jgi:23S rRNA (cytosine1962-C5)-methyltransferase
MRARVGSPIIAATRAKRGSAAAFIDRSRSLDSRHHAAVATSTLRRAPKDGARGSYNSPVTDLVDFQHRLAKNARHLRRWARREDVHAYRVYDRDVPEFPVVIDRFEAAGGDETWLQFQEVDTGWQQSEDEHREWLAHLIDASADVFEVPAERVSVKRRARQRVRGEKTSQHGPTGVDEDDLVVVEGGHRFLVNLHGYLDTGLFLDHRITRRMVGERATGRRFLNLFAYTGSFTVYAARGGAVSSESVDLSNTYCDWAERNLRLNGVDLGRHGVVRADVFTWLRDAVAAFDAGDRESVDLIVLDPPTFSNSKSMMGVLDVQRDHPWLIRQCLALLAPGGDLFFSTNQRTFVLDEQVQERARFVEISAKTVPPDFRDRRIHRCWHIRHFEG